MAEVSLIRDPQGEPPVGLEVDRRKLVADTRTANGYVHDPKKPRLSGWSEDFLGRTDLKGLESGEFLNPAARINAIKAALRARAKELFGSEQATVEGDSMTSADMLLVDPTAWDQHLERHLKRVAETASSDEIYRKMHIDGIGYDGMPGINYRVGLETLTLPEALGEKMRALRDATFVFYDVVAEQYGKDKELTDLLDYKRPKDRIPSIMKGRVDLVRPDIVMVREEDGSLGLRITEFESAPGGHGILASLEAGVDSTELVDMYAEYLKGRPFRVCLTNDWSGYVFEQAAFCKQLRERHGIDASVIMDRPLEEVAASALANWKRHNESLPWDNDLMRRLREGNIADVVYGSDDFRDADIADSVVFRMAYLSNLSAGAIAALDRAKETMNAQRFDLESKGLMAALHVPAVRKAIAERDPAHLVALDGGVTYTKLLTPETLPEIVGDRKEWIVKFAAWSFDNKDWGSRSVVMGSECGDKKWREGVAAYEGMPHPVVLQRFAPSVKVPAAYRDLDGKHGAVLRAGNRLTPFFVRGASTMPTMVTLREGSSKIHGATDAVVSKVVFGSSAVQSSSSAS